MQSTKKKTSKQQVEVFIRPRPFNNSESNAVSSFQIINDKEIMLLNINNRKYNFSKVFRPETKQVDVYSTVVAPLIPDVLNGFSATIFAYGPTGTGKTFTIAGESSNHISSWDDDSLVGCISRSAAHIFNELAKLNNENTVRVSFVELYNEKLNDLLNDECDPALLRLYEDPRQKGSVQVYGLKQVTVWNNEDVNRLLQTGIEKRKIKGGNSRSHAVFTIIVNTKEETKSECLVKTGKLTLVDLAGSENIYSGAKDSRAREANQSLVTLNKVIKNLVENCSYIPYRDSKLTRLLQDSLGGHTKTSFIATISPAFSSMEETINALECANRISNIINQPEMNQKVSYTSVVNDLNVELERLKRDLRAAKTTQGFYLSAEDYQQLVTETKNQKKNLTEITNAKNNLEEMIRAMEEDKNIKRQQWNEMMESFEITKVRLTEAHAEAEFNKKEAEMAQVIAANLEEADNNAIKRAKDLLSVTNARSKDASKLHHKVNTLYEKSIKNRLILQNISSLFEKYVTQTKDNINRYNSDQLNIINIIHQLISNLLEGTDHSMKILKENVQSIRNIVLDFYIVDATIAYHTDLQSLLNNQNQLCNDLVIEIDHIVNSRKDLMEFVTKLFHYLKNILTLDIQTIINDHTVGRNELLRFFDESFINFDGMNKKINSIAENSEIMKNNLNDSIFVYKNDVAKQKQELKNDITELEETIQSMIKMKQVLQEKMENCNETEDFLNNLQIKNNSMKIYKNCEIFFHNLSKFTSETKINLKQDVNNLQNSKLLQKYDQGVQNICQHFNHSLENIDSSLNKFSRNVTSAVQDLKKKSKDLITTENEMLKVYVSSILENLEKVDSSNITDMVNDDIATILVNLRNVEDEMNTLCSATNNRLDEADEIIKEKCQNHAVNIEHAGDTPVPQNYKYPSKVIKQLQRKAIIEKFEELENKENLCENMQNGNVSNID